MSSLRDLGESYPVIDEHYYNKKKKKNPEVKFK